MDSDEEEVVLGTPVIGSPASSERSSPVEYSSVHNSPMRFSPKVFGKHSPVAVSSVVGSPLTKSKVLELKKDELKIRLESLGHEAKGTKVQLQQQLQAVLSPGRAEAKVQREQWELERQWQREDKEREFQLAKLKMEADLKLETKRLEAQADEKRSVNNTAVTKQRLDIEAKQLLIEKKKLELELKKLEIGASSGVKLEKASDSGMFRVSSALKLIPKFDNGDIENYLRTFEKAVVMNKIPKEQWSNLLFPQLTLKGREVFQSLELEQIMDYDVVKERVLLAYERVPEFYRKRFRGMIKEKHETYSTFAFRLSLPFRRWVESSKSVDSVEKLCELFQLEQFVKALPNAMIRWITDKKPATVAEAAKYADEYEVQCKHEPMVSNVAEGYKKQNFGWNATQNSPKFANFRKVSPNRRGRGNGDKFADDIVCAYCKSRGHSLQACWRLKQRNSKASDGNWRSTEPVVAPIGLVGEPLANVDKGLDSLCVRVDKRYAPFCDNGFLSLPDGNTVSVCCLRDSGCLQSIIAKNVLTASGIQELDERRLVKGISGEVLELPLVEVRVDSKFVKGTVILAVLDQGLPEGVDMLVGN